MSVPEEDVPKKAQKHEVGEDLASLSLDELSERIDLLSTEIKRIEETMRAKRASADVAASFFKS